MPNYFGVKQISHSNKKTSEWYCYCNSIRHPKERLLSFLFAKAMRRPTPEKEIGEVVHDPNQNLEVYYMQIISPRTYRKMLVETGFEVAYYNSRQRIDQQHAPSFIADFDPDFKFYVARKTQIDI